MIGIRRLIKPLTKRISPRPLPTLSYFSLFRAQKRCIGSRRKKKAPKDQPDQEFIQHVEGFKGFTDHPTAVMIFQHKAWVGFYFASGGLIGCLLAHGGFVPPLGIVLVYQVIITAWHLPHVVQTGTMTTQDLSYMAFWISLALGFGIGALFPLEWLNFDTEVSRLAHNQYYESARKG